MSKPVTINLSVSWLEDPPKDGDLQECVWLPIGSARVRLEREGNVTRIRPLEQR